MKRYLRTSSAIPIATAVLMLGITAPAAWAKNDGDEIPFEAADLFLELNDTDGDLGIHGLIDGEEWKRLEIRGPGKRKILNVGVLGRLRRQGLTEIFFESAEPSFDELAPAEFFQRFPEGEYQIEGKTLEGEKLQSTAALTHVLPAPPGNILISGISAAENCDASPLPSIDGDEPVIISWAPVTQSHPEIGKSGPLEVVKYQFVVEREEPTLLIFSVELPPNVTQFEIPSGFLDLGDEFKFEIVVKEASGNQTAVESCFELE